MYFFFFLITIVPNVRLDFYQTFFVCYIFFLLLLLYFSNRLLKIEFLCHLPKLRVKFFIFDNIYFLQIVFKLFLYIHGTPYQFFYEGIHLIFEMNEKFLRLLFISIVGFYCLIVSDTNFPSLFCNINSQNPVKCLNFKMRVYSFIRVIVVRVLKRSFSLVLEKHICEALYESITSANLCENHFQDIEVIHDTD